MYDHELKITGGSPSATQGLNLIRDKDGRAIYTVTEITPEYQEELRFTQKNWVGGHGQHDSIEPDLYFEGQSIDTTQVDRLFLGPLITEVNESDDSDLDASPNHFLWYSAIKKWLCATAGKIYRYGVGPLYEYYDEGDDGAGLVQGITWKAQTFTPLDAHTVTSVALKLYRVGSPTTLTVSIKATTASKPSGNDLCSGTTNGDALTTDPNGEWVTVTLGTGTALSAATKYAIVVRALTASGADFAMWRCDVSGSTYSSGAYVYSPDSGTNWTISGGDFMFKEYSSTTTSLWTAASTTLAGVTDLKEYNGVAYAAMGTTNLYYYSTDGNTWTITDLTDGYADKFFVSPNPAGTASVLYKTKFPNELSYTTDGRTIGTTGVQWTSPAYIGDTSNNITNVFLVGDKLMIGKTDGLFYYDTDGGVHPIMDDLKHNRTIRNFQYAIPWQSITYFSLGNGVGELTPEDIFDEIGPLANIDDIGKVGHCVGLTSDKDYIYVAMDEGTNTIIYKGHQVSRIGGLRWEWCPWIYLGTENCSAIAVCQHSSTDRRLWFGYGDSTAYVILTDDPTADSSARFAPSGFIRMPYTYGTNQYWDKMFQSIVTETEACTAGLKVTPKYRKDTDTGDGTALTAAIITNGTVKTDLTNELSCKKIQFELHLETNSSSSTPEVKMFEARGIERPEVIRIHDCVYAVGSNSYQKASTLRTYLRLGRSVTTLLRFSDLRYNPDGTGGTENTDYVWVTMMPGFPEEPELYHEKGRSPELGIHVKLREVSF